ncbi:hypothetical protein MKW92_039508, partial [Papaver armeniacum]
LGPTRLLNMSIVMVFSILSSFRIATHGHGYIRLKNKCNVGYASFYQMFNGKNGGG